MSPLQSFWYFGYLVCFCFTFYILSLLPRNTWYFVFHILHLSILRKDTWGPPSELLRHHPRFPIWGFPNILRFIHLTICLCLNAFLGKLGNWKKKKVLRKKNENRGLWEVWWEVWKGLVVELYRGVANYFTVADSHILMRGNIGVGIIMFAEEVKRSPPQTWISSIWNNNSTKITENKCN